MRRERVCGVDAEVAETLAERLRGLIGRDGLASGTGMLITRCNCIHTCFMRFPVDATFIDKRSEVVKTVRNIRPWRLFVWGGFRAVSVLETAQQVPALQELVRQLPHPWRHLRSYNRQGQWPWR